MIIRCVLFMILYFYSSYFVNEFSSWAEVIEFSLLWFRDDSNSGNYWHWSTIDCLTTSRIMYSVYPMSVHIGLAIQILHFYCFGISFYGVLFVSQQGSWCHDILMCMFLIQQSVSELRFWTPEYILFGNCILCLI